MWLGVVLGLAAAAAQSISYVLSRLYVIRRHNAVLHLLVLGHIFMGVASVAALPFLPLGQLPSPGHWAWPLAGAALFYLCGQAGMFLVLRHHEASRISPLLGLKIPMLAAISVLVLSGHLGAWQWAAIGTSVAAALVLRTSGPRLSGPTVVGILLTCVGYSLSDLHIVALVDGLRVGGMSFIAAVLVGVALSYVLCGVLAVAVLPWTGASLGDWRFALPWSAAWLVAMVLLFGCFATAGVVFGNILQSTRGLMSVAMGWAIAHLGHLHIEGASGRAVMLRRAAAALLMVAAIAMYSVVKVP